MTDENRREARFPAAVRVKLKYPDVDTFIQKYAANISRGGIFITSKNPPPIGTALKFEFLLASGESTTSIIRGEGHVKWVREFDPQAPSKSHGMGIEFTELDESSRALIEKALAFRAQKAKGGSAAATPPEPPSPGESAVLISPVAASPVAVSPVDSEPSAPVSTLPKRAKRAVPPGPPPRSNQPSRLAEAPSALDVDALAAEMGVSEARVSRALEESRNSGDESDLDRLINDPGAPSASKDEALANLNDLLDRRRP